MMMIGVNHCAQNFSLILMFSRVSGEVSSYFEPQNSKGLVMAVVEMEINCYSLWSFAVQEKKIVYLKIHSVSISIC